MHKAVRDYLHRIKVEIPEVFINDSTIEFGSLNINGTPREFFESKNYVGVDAVAGKDVDAVALCHEYDYDEMYDTVVCTEMLEHDPYWDLSINKMVDLVKIDGNLIITVASPLRSPHGQTKYTPIERYYRGIKASDLLKIVLTKGRFKKVCLENGLAADLMLFCYWRY